MNATLPFAVTPFASERLSRLYIMRDQAPTAWIPVEDYLFYWEIPKNRIMDWVNRGLLPSKLGTDRAGRPATLVQNLDTFRADMITGHGRASGKTDEEIEARLRDPTSDSLELVQRLGYACVVIAAGRSYLDFELQPLPGYMNRRDGIYIGHAMHDVHEYARGECCE